MKCDIKMERLGVEQEPDVFKQAKNNADDPKMIWKVRVDPLL